MIEFVTLLLGLVTGPRTVEVSVSEEVASVEILLDGESAGFLVAEPWFLDCDFGDELAPHELLAVAYGDEQQELGRARQWINLPQGRSQARLSLERTGDEAVARLIWTALDQRDPASVRLTFDGQPLVADDLDAIVLPPHDPRSLHFLRAEVEFTASVRADAELVFGGSFGEAVSTELTAVALAADRRPPEPGQMAGWLHRRGRALTVVAVERGPVNLLVVREQSAATLDGLRQVFSQYEVRRAHSRQPPVQIPVLGEGDRVRFVYPTAGGDRLVVGRGAAPIGIEQVPVSRDASDFGPLFSILTHGFSDHDRPLPKQQLADAVAIAGMVAAAGDQRRAVVLIHSGATRDDSRYSPATVRAYLARLGVPLAVWSIPAAGGASALWPGATDVSELRAMNRALDELRKTLRSQVVVWVEGAHLSHEIELSDRAKGLQPAAPVPDLPPAEETPAPLVASPGPLDLGPGWQRQEIGSYTLYSQVKDRGLIDYLGRIARDHGRLYAERYGLSRGEARGVLVLFADRPSLLEFQRDRGHEFTEGRPTGYFRSPDLVVMYRGFHSRQEMAATLIHELTHLVSWQSLHAGGARGPALPPWLDEGLADDLSLSAADRKGRLEAEPLGPANLHYGRDLGAILWELERKLDEGGAPTLQELSAMDRSAFLSGDSQLHYLLASLWVRYLAGGADGELATGFRAYLASVATGGEGRPEALAQRLGRDWPRLESGFRGWLRQQRARLGS